MKLWTVTYILADGTHSFQECPNLEDVMHKVNYLIESRGVRKEYITIFPPNTGYTL